MSESTPSTNDIRQLDSGYARETRSLLYQAYRHEPVFAWLFESGRIGYEHRVRATIRELVRQHYLQDMPALGLFVQDQLVGVALIAPPQRRLGITESWAWRLRMLLSTGLRCTRRYLEYHQAILACLPSDAVHVLPLIGVHPDFQGQHHDERLLRALHQWCEEDTHSRGVVVDTSNPYYLDFYRRQGYEEIGEVEVGPVREYVFFHPSHRESISNPA